MRWKTAIFCLGLGAMAMADPPVRGGGHPVPDPKPETEPIPEKYAAEQKVAIKLEKLEQQQAFLGMQVTLRIINPTDQALTYRGFYARSPDIRRQQWRDGKWQDRPQNAERIKPGLSMQDITLQPGQSVVFVMGVTAEQMPTRMGLDYTTQGKASFTAWSDKIER